MTDFFELKNIPSFGVAGNFTGHLEQAGEAVDFQNVKTAEVNAPKAVFPTYIPNPQNKQYKQTPAFLTTFPFDKKTIVFPKGEQKLQIEPECAIVFNAIWNNGKLKDLTPVCFGASNDCSIRKEGAKKISQKKNWGNASKGFSEQTIQIESFTKDSLLNKYRIASFLVRNNEVYAYGEDSAVRDYSYIYEKLARWLIDKFNNQQNEGPAEAIYEYLKEADFPKQIMVSIGATRYTNWGETNFLQADDEAVIVLYPEDKYNFEIIKKYVKIGLNGGDGLSVLRQKIIL